MVAMNVDMGMLAQSMAASSQMEEKSPLTVALPGLVLTYQMDSLMIRCMTLVRCLPPPHGNLAVPIQ